MFFKVRLGPIASKPQAAPIAFRLAPDALLLPVYDMTECTLNDSPRGLSKNWLVCSPGDIMGREGEVGELFINKITLNKNNLNAPRL